MSRQKRIKVAILGIGNCASSLIQGVHHYRAAAAPDGAIFDDIGGYGPGDLEVALAYDVDERKVGQDLSQAIFAPPNNTYVFYPSVPSGGIKVSMGRVLDGVAPHMLHAGERGFQLANAKEPGFEEVVQALRHSGAEVLINFLPVGASEATEFYLNCALEAGVAVVNCIPVFIASDPDWADRFRSRGVPLIGDDIKAQIGATIIHRVLSDLLARRGVSVRHTYQLNTGGNTDFMNMLDRSRLGQKKLSKTEAVQSALGQRLADEDIVIGPSEYVPWLKDNKVCFLRIEGEHWGGSPVQLEMRLSVEDSPNSAACVLDAVRFAKLALDRGEGGPLAVPSAYYCKHPPQQMEEGVARQLLNEIAKKDVDQPQSNGSAHMPSAVYLPAA